MKTKLIWWTVGVRAHNLARTEAWARQRVPTAVDQQMLSVQPTIIHPQQLCCILHSVCLNRFMEAQGRCKWREQETLQGSAHISTCVCVYVLLLLAFGNVVLVTLIADNYSAFCKTNLHKNAQKRLTIVTLMAIHKCAATTIQHQRVGKLAMTMMECTVTMPITMDIVDDGVDKRATEHKDDRRSCKLVTTNATTTINVSSYASKHSAKCTAKLTGSESRVTFLRFFYFICPQSVLVGGMGARRVTIVVAPTCQRAQQMPSMKFRQ